MQLYCIGLNHHPRFLLFYCNGYSIINQVYPLQVNQLCLHMIMHAIWIGSKLPRIHYLLKNHLIVWMDVHKIIDVFHFKNHTSSRCKQLYNPAIYKSEHPFWNTQAGEQTFIWLGGFKNIVCSMPKHHHLFYIHRMVLRRNEYTAKCYRNGHKPILLKTH